MTGSLTTGIPLLADLYVSSDIGADLSTVIALVADLASESELTGTMGSSFFALVLYQGEIGEIEAADVGTGMRPIVLVDGAYLAERQDAEGTPVVYNKDGTLETLPSDSQLVI